MQNFTADINAALHIKEPSSVSKRQSEEKKAQQKMSAAPPSNQAH